MFTDGKVTCKFKDELTNQQKKILKYLLPALKEEAIKANSNSVYIDITLDHKTIKGLMSKLKLKKDFGFVELLLEIKSIELLLEKFDSDGNFEIDSTSSLFENIGFLGGDQLFLHTTMELLSLYSACELISTY